MAFAQIVPRNTDVNDDGFVNTKDLVIVSRNFGQSGTTILGDVNQDGEVDIRDLVLVANSF